MEIDWTPVVTQVLLAIITGAIGLVSVALTSFLKGKLSNEQIRLLETVAGVGVRAAEQIYGAANGAEKLAYATTLVQRELDVRGVKVNAESVRAAIEAALMSEFNYPASVEVADPPAETVVTMESGNAEGATA